MQIPVVAANIVGGVALGVPSILRGFGTGIGAGFAAGAGLRDTWQRARGRLTTSELRQGRAAARRSLAAAAYLDSPQARQIKAQLSRSGQIEQRPPA